MQQDGQIIITGQYNTARVLAPDIQDDAYNLIKSMLNDRSFSNENIVIMPDVHYSSACCVGFTKTCNQTVFHPYIIGNDAGCGVTCIQFPRKYEQYLNQQFNQFAAQQKDVHDEVILKNNRCEFFKSLFNNMDTIIRDQRQVSEQFKSYQNIQEEDELVMQTIQFRNKYAMQLDQKLIDQQDYMKRLKILYQKLKTKRYTFGTLGSGNHFVEIGYQVSSQSNSETKDLENEDKKFYLTVHSGSRALGKSLSDYYTSLSINSDLFDLQLDKSDAQNSQKIIENNQLNYQRLISLLSEESEIGIMYFTEAGKKNIPFIINVQESVYSCFVKDNTQILQRFFDLCIAPIVEELQKRDRMSSGAPKQIDMIIHLLPQLKAWLVSYLKKQNRETEISKVISQISKLQRPIGFQGILVDPKLKSEYLDDLNVVQSFAQLNRFQIIFQVFQALGVDTESDASTLYIIESMHNYIDQKDHIVRKGAIRSVDNEKLGIPLNMAEGIAIFTGKSIQPFNFSAPHGLGRLFKRKDRQFLTLSQFKESVMDVFSNTVNERTLDEAPEMYKKFGQLLPWMLRCVSGLNFIIKPIYNLKAFKKLPGAEAGGSCL